MHLVALVNFNRAFMSICASWASLSREFGLPANWLLWLADRATIVWSCVIFVTNLLKFLTFHDQQPAAAGANKQLNNQPAESTTSFLHANFQLLSRQFFASNQKRQQQSQPQYDHYQLRHLLTLDYLPRISEFGKLYYGLISVSIGAPLVWRLYLNFYRPFTRKAIVRSKSGSFKVGHKLVSFFLHGPALGTGKETTKQQVRPLGDTSSVLLSLADRMPTNKCLGGSKFKVLGCLDSDSIRRRERPLTRLHDRCKPDDTDQALHTAFHPLEKTYLIPVRVYDLLDDKSKARWVHLFKYTYFMCTWTTLISIPILILTAQGLMRVMEQFTLPVSQRGTFATFMVLYGTSEQVYALTQAALLFIFTNIFITLFHADLRYKWRPIQQTVTRFGTRYVLSDRLRLYEGHIDRKLSQLPKRQHLLRLQHKIWAYFDYINQLDDFVSKYSVISMVTFVIGISFGQSYLKVKDEDLKVASACVIFSNILSFSYLYLLSWDIEQKSTKLHTTMMTIVARDRDFVTKRMWQKILLGFFEKDSKRTFTLNDWYPLNLHSYLKVSLGFATISFVLNRLFHKRAYELGFQPDEDQPTSSLI